MRKYGSAAVCACFIRVDMEHMSFTHPNQMLLSVLVHFQLKMSTTVNILQFTIKVADHTSKFIWKELWDRLKSLSLIVVGDLFLVTSLLPDPVPVTTVETTYCWSSFASDVLLLTMN